MRWYPGAPWIPGLSHCACAPQHADTPTEELLLVQDWAAVAGCVRVYFTLTPPLPVEYLDKLRTQTDIKKKKFKLVCTQVSWRKQRRLGKGGSK